METYITVSFWMGLFAVVINLLTILNGSFPLKIQVTLGRKTVEVLAQAGFIVWAGFLLFS